MTCRVVPVPGGVAFVCGGPKPKPCRAPGCNAPSIVLCDWKLHRVVDGKKEYTGKTCDYPMCARHRTRVGEDKDLCPPHLAEAIRSGYLNPKEQR